MIRVGVGMTRAGVGVTGAGVDMFGVGVDIPVVGGGVKGGVVAWTDFRGARWALGTEGRVGTGMGDSRMGGGDKRELISMVAH